MTFYVVFSKLVLIGPFSHIYSVFVIVFVLTADFNTCIMINLLVTHTSFKTIVENLQQND